MFEKIGGRKFIASTLTVAVGLIVMAVKGDVPPGLLHLLEVTLGVFASGNVVASFAGALYGSKKASAAEIPPTGPESSPGADAPVALDAQPEPQTTTATPSPVTPEQIYGGLSEVYQKVTAVEASVGEIGKSVNVSQKVLNVLLEKAQ